MKKSSRLKPPFLRRVWCEPSSQSGYPFNLPLFANGFEQTFSRAITIIAGENGTGKSTLIEAIAAHCGFNLASGNRNNLYDGAPNAENVLDVKSSWLPRINEGFFMRAESFVNFASYIDDNARANPVWWASYGGKSLHAQSHGEAFLSLLTNRINGRGIYLFDEPEAALSPMRQLSLLSLMSALEKSGDAQIIMATHSPMLMAYPNAQLLYLSEGQLRECNFRDTEHYKTLRRFLESPETFLAQLL